MQRKTAKGVVACELLCDAQRQETEARAGTPLDTGEAVSMETVSKEMTSSESEPKVSKRKRKRTSKGPSKLFKRMSM